MTWDICISNMKWVSRLAWGGNISPNPLVSVLVPRPVSNRIDGMCQCHGSKKKTHNYVVVPNLWSVYSFYMCGWGELPAQRASNVDVFSFLLTDSPSTTRLGTVKLTWSSQMTGYYVSDCTARILIFFTRIYRLCVKSSCTLSNDTRYTSNQPVTKGSLYHRKKQKSRELLLSNFITNNSNFQTRALRKGKLSYFSITNMPQITSACKGPCHPNTAPRYRV